jgi:hypothetical protein
MAVFSQALDMPGTPWPVRVDSVQTGSSPCGFPEMGDTLLTNTRENGEKNSVH